MRGVAKPTRRRRDGATARRRDGATQRTAAESSDRDRGPIDRERSLSLTESKGKRKPYTVKPLVEDAPTQQAAPDTSALEAAFNASGMPQGQWLTYASQVVGRALSGPGDLSVSEQGAVVDALNQDAAEKAAEGGQA